MRGNCERRIRSILKHSAAEISAEKKAICFRKAIFTALIEQGRASPQVRSRLQNPSVLGNLAAKIELVRTSNPHLKLGTKQGTPYATGRRKGGQKNYAITKE